MMTTILPTSEDSFAVAVWKHVSEFNRAICHTLNSFAYQLFQLVHTAVSELETYVTNANVFLEDRQASSNAMSVRELLSVFGQIVPLNTISTSVTEGSHYALPKCSFHIQTHQRLRSPLVRRKTRWIWISRLWIRPPRSGIP